MEIGSRDNCIYTVTNFHSPLNASIQFNPIRPAGSRLMASNGFDMDKLNHARCMTGSGRDFAGPSQRLRATIHSSGYLLPLSAQ
jgi:hypothetical protein